MQFLTSVSHAFRAWRWSRRFFRDPVFCLMDLHKEFGPVCVFENPLPGRERGRRYVFAVDSVSNRQVLSNTDAFAPGAKVLRGPPDSAQRRIRRGILAMRGDEHRAHRRIMQPPFAKKAVESSIPLMGPPIDAVIEMWRPEQPMDMFVAMRTLSNWVAANVLFGNEDFAASLHIGGMIDRWAFLDSETRSSLLGHLPPWPGTPFRRELKHAEALETTMRDFIDKKRREKTSSNDVLSMLIRAVDSGQSGMTDANLVAHSISLYGASFETTANALTWTMFMIAQHPVAAARLYEELSALPEGWPPDSQRLDSLPFLDAVLRESMRLMPPIPLTVRGVQRPLTLEGVELRTGDKVILCHYLTHRDPAVFPDPNRFDPTRWFASRPDPYQYLPFSAGPRLCLGAVFAMAEMKLVVARVMQRYRMEVVPGARIDAIGRIVLKPERGVPMILHRQDGAFTRSPCSGNIHRMVDLVSPETHVAVAAPGIGNVA